METRKIFLLFNSYPDSGVFFFVEIIVPIILQSDIESHWGTHGGVNKIKKV